MEIAERRSKNFICNHAGCFQHNFSILFQPHLQIWTVNQTPGTNGQQWYTHSNTAISVYRRLKSIETKPWSPNPKVPTEKCQLSFSCDFFLLSIYNSLFLGIYVSQNHRAHSFIRYVQLRNNGSVRQCIALSDVKSYYLHRFTIISRLSSPSPARMSFSCFATCLSCLVGWASVQFK